MTEEPKGPAPIPVTGGAAGAPDEDITLEGARSDARVVAKGGGVQVVGQLISRGFAFLFVAIAVRLLGAAGYGIYRQISQVLVIAGTVAPGGFNYAAVRYMTKARATGDHAAVRGSARVALAGSVVSSLLVFAAVLLGAAPIARAFGDSVKSASDMETFLRIGAAFIPMYAVMQVMRWSTQAYKTMVPSVVVNNIVQPGARFLLGGLAIVVGFGVAGAVTSLVLSAGLGLLASLWYYHRMLTAAERAARPRLDVGPIVRFAIPQLGVTLFSVQSLGLGIIILGLLGTSRDVGLFGVALSLQGLGSVFLTGISGIWAPVVTDLYERGEIERLGRIFKTVNRWVATFSFPVFAALIIQGDLFARVLAGKDGQAAAVLVAILAVGNFFFVATGPTSHVLSMTGRPVVNLMNSIMAVLLYVGLGFWIVPAHGAVGMAWVDATVTVLVNTARVVESKLLVGVHPFGRSFLKPVVATAALSMMLLISRPVAGDSLALQGIAVVIAAATYLLVLRLMGIDPEERDVYERIKTRMLRGARR